MPGCQFGRAHHGSEHKGPAILVKASSTGICSLRQSITVATSTAVTDSPTKAGTAQCSPNSTHFRTAGTSPPAIRSSSWETSEVCPRAANQAMEFRAGCLMHMTPAEHGFRTLALGSHRGEKPFQHLRQELDTPHAATPLHSTYLNLS